MKPEWIAVVVNVIILAIYVWQRAEPGKILYWFGATCIVSGLLMMKG